MTEEEINKHDEIQHEEPYKVNTWINAADKFIKTNSFLNNFNIDPDSIKDNIKWKLLYLLVSHDIFTNIEDINESGLCIEDFNECVEMGIQYFNELDRTIK